MAAPQDWIGKQVTFGLEGASDFATGELVEVSDQGIVLIATRVTNPPAPPIRVFYPWRVIRLIQLEPGQEDAGLEDPLYSEQALPSSGQEPPS